MIKICIFDLDGTLARTQESIARPINMTLNYFGLPEQPVEAFNYFAGEPAKSMDLHRGYFLQKDICDYVLASLEYSNNVKAHIQVSWLHPFKEQRVVVVGSRGMLWFDDAKDKKVYYTDKHVEWRDGIPECTETDSVTIPYDDSQLPLERELRYFVAHLKEPPKYSTGEDGCALVKALEESRK